MKLAIDIVKSILLSKLEKDANFDNNKTDATFWKLFATALLDFEKDDSVCKNAIFSLELNNPEKIISTLPKTYNSYVKELAENHVLGNESEAINSLLKSNNQVFEEEVRFLNNLEQAIIEIERERIKAELPTAYESLVAELSEKEKKEVPVITLTEVPIASVTGELIPAASKVIPLSWIKYAAAACIVLTAGVMYFKFNTDTNLVQPGDNNVVTAPEKVTPSNNNIITEIPAESLTAISTVSNTTPVIESALGFASKQKKIKIIENNQKARMKSIVIAIDRYRKFLEKELTENKVSYGQVVKEIQSKINALQNELALLKERENHYVFDGKELIIYNSSTAGENSIVLYDKKYYLKQNSVYFLLRITNKPENFNKLSNTDVIDNLNEIIIEQ